MARRVPGSNRSRPTTGGREPTGIGSPVGKGPKTRVVAQPVIKRTYTHCTGKTRKGQPCKAPNVKGEPYCIGHLNALRAKEAVA